MSNLVPQDQAEDLLGQRIDVVELQRLLQKQRSEVLAE